MDYMAFVDAHRQSNADVTIGCLPCDGERAQDFGLMKIDGDGNVTVRLRTTDCAPPLPPVHSAEPLYSTILLCSGQAGASYESKPGCANVDMLAPRVGLGADDNDSWV